MTTPMNPQEYKELDALLDTAMSFRVQQHVPPDDATIVTGRVKKEYRQQILHLIEKAKVEASVSELQSYFDNALGRPETCHEEVARADDLEPCGKTAVALRVDPQEGEPYPVCARHARASMVPLVDIVRFMLDRHEAQTVREHRNGVTDKLLFDDRYQEDELITGWIKGAI